MIPDPNHPWHRGKTSQHRELTRADLLDLPREDFGGEDDFDIPGVERRRIEAQRPLIETGYDPSVGKVDELDLCVRAFGTALPTQEEFGRYAQDAPGLGTFLG